MAHQGGVLTLSLPKEPVSQHATIVSDFETLDQCSISVQITGQAAEDQEVYFAFGPDAANTTGYRIANGIRTAGLRDDGTPTQVGSSAVHDGATSIIVAMTLDGGEVTFSTSLDGAVWEELGTLIDPNPHTGVPIGIGISALVNTAAMTVVVDNFNVYVP